MEILRLLLCHAVQVNLLIFMQHTYNYLFVSLKQDNEMDNIK